MHLLPSPARQSTPAPPPLALSRLFPSSPIPAKMKALKSLLKSKKSRPKHPGKEGEAFLRPALPPAYYGAFPSAFSLHFLGRSQDAKADYYILGLGTARNAAIHPLNAVTVHRGPVKHQVTLHEGPNPSDPALGLAGAEKFYKSIKSLVAVPSSVRGQDNEIVLLSPRKSVRFDSFHFTSVVASGVREEFEWRSDDVLSLPAGKLFERTCVRLKGGNGAEEIVGRWTDDGAPERTARLGSFRFEGSGATGELGSYWALMVVMTLLRITQMTMEVSGVTEKMVGAAGKGMLAGARMGMRA